MDRLPFVGREAELLRLRDALARGAAGHGSIVFVEGDAGIGKTVLLTELIGSEPTTPGVESTIFAKGHSSRDTGPQNAYQPFVEILAQLAQGTSGTPGFLTGLVKTVLKETAPDWLALIPVLGSALSATAKTARIGAQIVLQGQTTQSRSQDLVHQYLSAITRLTRGDHLLVLVLEDAHWIDQASADLMLRLADGIDTMKLVVLVSCRPDDEDQDGPLARLRFELAARNGLHVVALSGLSALQIATYLQQRYGTVFEDDFPDWLIHLCRGQPLYVSQYLDLLEQEGIIELADGEYRLHGSVTQMDDDWIVTGRIAEMPTSSNIEVLLDRRIQGLTDDERQMLQIGSVQGQHFDSLVLAQVSDLKELIVLSRLRIVSERYRIIGQYAGQDWLRDRAETYAFEHMLMHDAFYRKLGPRERQLYHEEIGQVLEGILGDYATPPRKLLIDIATHYKFGKRFAIAAGYYLRAAHGTYADGAAVEASYLSGEALDCMRSLAPDTPGRDPVLAEAVLLHLVCAVYGSANTDDSVDLLKVAVEGEEAAQKANDPSLRAEIAAIKGHLYIRTGNVPEGISVMRQAVTLAQETGDAVTEFFALTHLGSQLAKEDLATSVTVRYQALDVYTQRVSLVGLTSTQRDLMLRQYSGLLVLIGLGEFDTGDFEKAIDWLKRGMTELRDEHKFDELPAAMNYLAQVYAAIGVLEEAKGLLEESLRLQDGHGRDHVHPWVGYNQALLGKVLLEMGRFGSAAEVMVEAVRVSEKTRHIDLLSIVWNYEAEVLMHPGNPRVDIAAAEGVLRKNIEVSTAAGLHRSVAQAAALLGVLMTRRADWIQADSFSAQAISELDRYGDMPAVRTEELLYDRWLVLDGWGRRDDALIYLDRAWQVMQRKLGLMVNPEYRRAFVERVPLNLAIADAYRSSGLT